MATGSKRRANISLSKFPLNLPSGSVQAFAGSTAPDGWTMCDGAAVSRTTYAALFAVIGTTYGVGDGSTTFDLPDMRGQFLRALDDMGTAAGAANVDVDGTARTVGQTQSNATRKNGLTATTTSTTGTTSISGSAVSNGAHTHNITNYQDNAQHGARSRSTNGTTDNGTQATASGGAHTHTLSGTTGTPTTTSTTTVQNGDTETRPQNMGINYILKL